MPAPITIRDPATYHESKRGPSADSRGDAATPSGGSPPSAQTTDETARPGGINERGRGDGGRLSVLNDISMSPRLVGYVFSCVSNVVSLVTSMVFYLREYYTRDKDIVEKYLAQMDVEITEEQRKASDEMIELMVQKHHIYLSSGGKFVTIWKVYGSIAVSGLLTLITMAIVMAHFDSICCAKKNRISFEDGSKLERNLLLLLIILSVIALYVSTSKFSLGEAQANVFFSTWTNFASCSINYEVWRSGSGRNHTFQSIMFGPKRDWFLLAIISTMSLLSVIDYWTIKIGEDFGDMMCLDLDWAKGWIWFTMSVTISCWGVVLIDRYCKPHRPVKILEGIILLAIIGIDGYVIANFTGDSLDQVPCPSNLYFSAWGAFFLSVWIFSKMIQEGISHFNE